MDYGEERFEVGLFCSGPGKNRYWTKALVVYSMRLRVMVLFTVFSSVWHIKECTGCSCWLGDWKWRQGKSGIFYYIPEMQLIGTDTRILFLFIVKLLERVIYLCWLFLYFLVSVYKVSQLLCFCFGNRRNLLLFIDDKKQIVVNWR